MESFGSISGSFGSVGSAISNALANALDDNDRMMCCTKDNTSPNMFKKKIGTGFITGRREQVCGVDWWGNSTNCDRFVQNFCKSHTDDPRCACYSDPPGPDDPLEVKLIKANPGCYARGCNFGAYKPDSLKNSNCPPITICKQDLSTIGKGNMSFDNIVVQDCSSNNVTPKPIGGGSAVGTGTAAINASAEVIKAQQAREEAEYKQKMMYLIVIIVLVFLGYQMTKDDDSSDKAVSNSTIGETYGGVDMAD